MSTGIIELNDAGIRVGRVEDQGGPLSDSPGVAVIDNKDLLLGEAALAQARLHPVQTNSLFWHRLSAEPLPVPSNRFRHHADLAYSQLLSVHEAISDCDQVIFALPGSFTRDQISLLLGIVGECPFAATGLVDSAVAAAAVSGQSHSLLHIDLQLHQCIFTRMATSGDNELQREQVEVLPQAGVFALRERMAKTIADAFIDQSRFDPLHSASTEQSLYDQLPGWLQRFTAEAELFLEIGGKSVKMNREQLVGAVDGLYRHIAAKAEQLAAADTQILIADRLAAMPGLTKAFETRLNQTVTELPSSAVMQSIRENIAEITSEDGRFRFVQSLPLRNMPEVAHATTASAPASGATPVRARPTHLLVNHSAFPLGETALFVNLAEGRMSTDPDVLTADCSIRRHADALQLLPLPGRAIAVNGEAVSDNRPLHCGDRIGIAGQNPVLSVIEVVQSHGP